MIRPLFLNLALWLLLPSGLTAQDSVIAMLQSANEEQLAKLLVRYPKADTNQDGTLTRREAIAYVEAKSGKGTRSKGTAPTLENVSYGSHPRNVLDLWKAEGSGPRPLVVFIHGGGFRGGDKSSWRSRSEIQDFLDAGISCAALNYRFRKDAPIQEILRDAGRAIQFIRSKATEWNLDKTRIAAWGSSAGAGTSLWLATRDDLADPESEDLVLRESSRLNAAVLHETQATYDLTRWEEFLVPEDPSWSRSPDERAEFYHFQKASDLEKSGNAAILRECDMLRWITEDDAPLFILSTQSMAPPRSRGHYLHHPWHAREIEKHYKDVGIQCIWSRSKQEDRQQNGVGFLKEMLER